MVDRCFVFDVVNFGVVSDVCCCFDGLLFVFEFVVVCVLLFGVYWLVMLFDEWLRVFIVGSCGVLVW